MESGSEFSVQDIVRYRLERALETFEEAKLLSIGGKWNATVNRLYYACFYAVIALFPQKQIRVKSHSGTITLLSKEFIHKGFLAKKCGDLYSELFNKRQESDYKDFQFFTKEEIEPLIQQAEEFIATLKNLIENEPPI